MKFAAIACVLFSCFLFCSCEAEKAPGKETVETETKELPAVDLYVTSCKSGDSLLCDKAACIPTDDLHCSIEDFYFTAKGNVVQRLYCAGEDEAVWITGRYRATDSGMICQMDKAYHLNLKQKGGPVNYNLGKFYELNSKEPFLLKSSGCSDIRFVQRFTEPMRMKTGEEVNGIIPFGKIYFENMATERRMLEEMRKVKALKDL
jgi:hypothetical protein